jgi:hypothetical protein
MHGEMFADAKAASYTAASSGAVLGMVDHLRCRFARFKLCAHLLQTGSKRVNLLLLLCGNRFLLCDNRL